MPIVLHVGVAVPVLCILHLPGWTRLHGVVPLCFLRPKDEDSVQLDGDHSQVRRFRQGRRVGAIERQADVQRDLTRLVGVVDGYIVIRNVV